MKVNLLLTRLSNLYGVPKDTPSVAGFVAEYEKAMAVYVDSEMELAADWIRDTRKYKTWPTVPECLEALQRARATLRARARAASGPAAAGAVKRYTQAERKEAERFVDDCAAGKIDLGFCAAQLRSLAKTMQARRGRP